MGMPPDGLLNKIKWNCRYPYSYTVSNSALLHLWFEKQSFSSHICYMTTKIWAKWLCLLPRTWITAEIFVGDWSITRRNTFVLQTNTYINAYHPMFYCYSSDEGTETNSLSEILIHPAIFSNFRLEEVLLLGLRTSRGVPEEVQIHIYFLYIYFLVFLHIFKL